ncbi:hypothetical protein GCM10020001_107340 [Nonomuraea salmonea]
MRGESEQALPGVPSEGERTIDGLLEAMHLAGMEEMPALVSEHARLEGFSDVSIYVTDLQQLLLVPLANQVDAAGGPLPTIRIDGTLAGRAFRSVSLVRSQPGGEGPYRVWAPLLDGTERIGLLGVTVPHGGEVVERRIKTLASLVALLVMSKRPHSDSCARLVRARPMALSAEVLWNLLPPGTFAKDDVVVSAALEPAYEMGGDTYDYAIDGHTLHLSIYDAMGHDTSAGLTATLAMGGRPQPPQAGHEPGRDRAGGGRGDHERVRGPLRHRGAGLARPAYRAAGLGQPRAPPAAGAARRTAGGDAVEHPRPADGVRAERLDRGAALPAAARRPAAVLHRRRHRGAEPGR